MHECPACGQACDCDGDDLEGPAPDDCGCPCDGCAECPHAGPACDASGRCLLDAEDDDCDDDLSGDDSAPYVCPGCHAVGGERCAPGCPDAAIEAREDDEVRACAACGGVTAHVTDCPVAALDDDDDSACPSCGGHGAHYRSCPDLHYEGLAGDDDYGDE